MKHKLKPLDSLKDIYDRNERYWYHGEDYLAMVIRISCKTWVASKAHFQFCRWLVHEFCKFEQQCKPELIFFLYFELEASTSSPLMQFLRLRGSSAEAQVRNHMNLLQKEAPWIKIFQEPLHAPDLADLKSWLRRFVRNETFVQDIAATILDSFPGAPKQKSPDRQFLKLNMSQIERITRAVVKAHQQQPQ